MEQVEDLQENTKNGATILKCSIITVLILLGAKFSYLNVVAALLACYFIFAGSIIEMLQIMMYTQAFATIFKLQPGGYTFLNLLVVAAIIRLLIFKRNLRFKYCQIIVLLTFSSIVLLFGGANSIIKLISLCAYFIFMMLVFNQNIRIDLRNILLFFSLGIITASFAGLFSDYIPGLSSFMVEVRLKLGEGNYIERFCGIQVNPNFYTMDISIALAGLFGLIISRHAKASDYIFLVALSVFGIMSISKSFLVVYAMLLLLLIINLGKQNVFGLFRGLFVVGVLIAVVYFVADKAYINAYLNRLLVDNSSGASFSSVTTGRYDLWKSYLDYIFGNTKVLLFGEGLGASNYQSKVSHNYFIETVYYLGLVGASLYYLCFKTIFPKRDFSFRRSLVNYLPLIVLLVRGMAISLILRDCLIFYYIIIAVMLNADLQSNKINHSSERGSSKVQPESLYSQDFT